MIRFRNSGSNPETQTGIMGLLYEKFQGDSSFNLDEMAETIAHGHLLSSNGFTGGQALVASYKENKSKDSALMDSKLYVEIFRMLGWIVPQELGKSYPVVLSFLGEHVAKSTTDWQPLYEQCLMGLVTPTELTDNVKYSEKSRPLYAILRFMKELGGLITTKEMCIGPMCLDDSDSLSFSKLCKKLHDFRAAGHKKMEEAFLSFAKELEMKESSVTNCTRFPIAALRGVGFIDSDSVNLGGKKQHCFRITKKGEKILSDIRDMKDLRLEEFRSYPKSQQESLIRIGFYRLLARAGYDISPVEERMNLDKDNCRTILDGKDLLFSPYQTLQKSDVDKALGIESIIRKTKETVREGFSKGDRAETIVVRLDEDFHLPSFLRKEDLSLVKIIRSKLRNQRISSFVKNMMTEVFSYDQQKFYPFVTSLLRIMGFPCELSRQGDHGNRWDAIIKHPERSIPVEIKSPRESEVLTLKAIRQALENKIVLLSRKTFFTSHEITSLAICYKFPNDRAEAQRLIEDIYSSFGYNIGVIEVGTLLKSAASIIMKEKSINQEEIYKLKGFLYADI